MKHTQKKKNKINKKETSYTLLYIRVPSKKCSIIIVERVSTPRWSGEDPAWACSGLSLRRGVDEERGDQGWGRRSAHTLDRLPSPWKEGRKPQRQF